MSIARFIRDVPYCGEEFSCPTCITTELGPFTILPFKLPTPGDEPDSRNANSMHFDILRPSSSELCSDLDWSWKRRGLSSAVISEPAFNQVLHDSNPISRTVQRNVLYQWYREIEGSRGHLADV